MAVTSRNLHSARKLQPQARRSTPVIGTYPAFPIASYLPYIVTLVLCMVAVGLVANNLIGWGQTKIDDIRYGRPRMSQLSVYVGHNEGPAGLHGTPTQLIGMNLNRQIVVLEIPGGDVSKTRTLTGPYLFGANENLTPVRLRLDFVNADQQPDLIVSVKNEEIIYINENDAFRLINENERAEYESRQHK